MTQISKAIPSYERWLAQTVNEYGGPFTEFMPSNVKHVKEGGRKNEGFRRYEQQFERSDSDLLF